MVDDVFFFTGIFTGFIIAAIPGPIGIICLQRTLEKGRMVGLVSGLGTATADSIYCFIAGFGVKYISDLLIEEKVWLQLIGGLFLVILGIRTIFARPVKKQLHPAGTGLLKAYSSMFLLTITNPLTILLFAGIIAGLGMGESGSDYARIITFVPGVFIGSVLWWLIMSTGISLFHEKVNDNLIIWINRFAGVTIIIAGVISLINII